LKNSKAKPVVGGKWGNLDQLKSLFLNDNLLTGPIPPEMLFGLSGNLVELDLGHNNLNGTLSSLLGKMTKLERIDAQANRLEGPLPHEMNRMYPDIQLNLTNNL
jgi:hypothetical protein